jgi:hypothetical protein
MPHYLLTGAGFSRNWGGWLANEAFEYLLGAAEVDELLRSVLWDAKLRGEGFEGALAAAQNTYASEKNHESKHVLDRLTQAVIGMFGEMQAVFNGIGVPKPWEETPFQQFLARFDAIFTLNQDTLLETIYAGPVRWSERWYGSVLPYMKFIKEPDTNYAFMLREPLIEDFEIQTDDDYQPIYKLHGSYNWLSDPQGERLVVIGGNKVASIARFPVLARYQSEFQLKLMETDSTLMVVGYSFSDVHINSIIIKGVSSGLKIFIVDPFGLNVLDKEVRASETGGLVDSLKSGIIGASRRPLVELVTTGMVENQKLERFFHNQNPIVRMIRPPSPTPD